MADQKFGLVFNSIPEKCVEQMKTSHVYFVDDAKRGWSNAEGRATNILIEGENYQALRALEYTHAGKIGCIAIDPIYNTGNDGFVYNDNLVDSEDPYRHSKWLSFMKHRLEIAHRLLSENGIIILHIDDNEMAHLKLLCDQIFGEQNFVANLIWKNKFNGGYDAQFITIEHEYILVYAKNINEAKLNYVPFNVEDDKAYKGVDEYSKTRGKFKVMNLDDKSLKYSESLDFKIKAPDGSYVEPENCWRWGKEKVQWGIENGFLEFVKDKKNGNWRVNKKQYQYCDNDGNALTRAYPLRSIIEGVSNTNSANEIKEYLGDKTMFNYAKPVELIKQLLFVSTQKDSIVLDFFAGSGTTGQAVAELNKEDGGNRQFILITNNEKSDRLPNGIARDCTYPRLEKTIKEYTNLRYLRVQTLKHTDKHPSDSARISQLQVENRMLPILSLLHNTHNPIEKGDKYTIFTNHNGTFFLGVYYNDDKLSAIKHDDIKKLRKLLKSYGKNAIEINTPGSGYVGEYYKFIQANNKGNDNV
jgi:adenine-specific DNA-methyltransferase